MTLANFVLTGLQPLRWRGLEAPCSDASYRYRNDYAERRYIYADVYGHERLGLSSMEVRASLIFSNSLEPGLYPERWQQWQAALRLGTIGDLQHPDVGTIKAMVTDVDVQFSAEMLSGIRVNLTFVETRESESSTQDFGSPFSSLSIETTAQNVLTLADAIAIPATYLDQIRDMATLGSAAILGQVSRSLGAIVAVIDIVDNLATGEFLGNDRWVLRNQLLTLYFAAKSLDDELLNGISSRKTAKFVTQTTLTLPRIAEDLGNTLTEIVDLNPALLGAPAVPSGTTVVYYV